MALGEVLGGVGGLVGGIVNLARGSKGSGRAQERKALEVMMKLQDPRFDPREIPWQDLQVFAEFFPEVYEAVVPDELKLGEDSPEAREAQVRSLAKLEGIRDEGLPLAERIAQQEAQEAIAQEQQRGQDFVLRDLAQRGRLGGGEEFAARVAGGQQATDLGARMGRDLARDAVAQRLAATYGAAELGGRLRGQDIEFSRNAAEAVNRFNEMRTGRENEAAAAAAAIRNLYGGQRAQERQRVGEENVRGRMEAAWANLERKDRNELLGKEFALDRARAQAGALLARGAGREAREARRRAQTVALGESAGKTVGGIGGLFAGGM